jgi:hypothetical protein
MLLLLPRNEPLENLVEIHLLGYGEFKVYGKRLVWPLQIHLIADDGEKVNEKVMFFISKD